MISHILKARFAVFFYLFHTSTQQRTIITYILTRLTLLHSFSLHTSLATSMNSLKQWVTNSSEAVNIRLGKEVPDTHVVVHLGTFNSVVGPITERKLFFACSYLVLISLFYPVYTT